MPGGLATWRCPAPSRADRLLPVLLYMLGPAGPQLARDVFQLHEHDRHIGDVYMVMDEGAPGASPPFMGPVGARVCVHVLTKPRAAVGYVAGMRGHYSQKYVMQKLDLLESLPRSLDSIVLLDSDLYALPGYDRLLRAQLEQMGPRQFVAAARAEARTYIKVGGRVPSNCTNEWCLDIPKQSEGINSGCLVLNLPRFRAWNATFCRNGGGARPWWACVLEQWRNGYLFQGGDNGVWNTLLALHPEVWRSLPCGTHASVGVLRGLART